MRITAQHFWLMNCQLEDHLNLLVSQRTMRERVRADLTAELLGKFTSLQQLLEQLQQELKANPEAENAQTLKALIEKLGQMEQVVKSVLHTVRHGSVELSLLNGMLSNLGCLTDAVRSINRPE